MDLMTLRAASLWRRPRDGTPDGARARESAAAAVTVDGLRARYLAAVYRYVARRVPDAATAEDVAADTFAAAFAAIHKCPRPAPDGADDDPAKAWLIGIARRKVADVYRRQGRRGGAEIALHDLSDAALPPDLVGGGPEGDALRAERARVMRGILAGLREEQREALLLKYGDGLSQAEIARVLGRSTAAVNSLLQRARAAAFERGRDYFDAGIDGASPAPEGGKERNTP